MIRVNGHYLFEIGSQIQPLTETKPSDKLGDIYFSVLIAEGALSPFVYSSVYQFRNSILSGKELIERVRELKERCETEHGDESEPVLGAFEHYQLKSALDKFLAVIGAELQMSPLYLVTQKGAYDTERLVANGEVLFPADLENKVPEAVADIQQATKCLAFELPTACGFHLHRANESVLRKWYDAVSGGAQPPTTRNIGDFLRELNSLQRGDKRVISALKDLKDLHRNPLIHPEHSLENIDEAIALLGSVQAVVTAMLKDIPVQPPPAASIPKPGSGGIVTLRPSKA